MDRADRLRETGKQKDRQGPRDYETGKDSGRRTRMGVLRRDTDMRKTN